MHQQSPKRLNKNSTMKPHTLTARDTGLDLLRFVALSLMIFAHFPISQDSIVVTFIKFIARSAPALFYFAFGMTFQHFARKDSIIKLRIAVVFFVIALLHNMAFTGQVIHYEFFFFLWFAQIFMTLVTLAKRPTRLCAILLFLILFVWIIMPDNSLTAIFKAGIQGNFPFLPWLCFVLAGFLFSHRSKTNFILPALFLLVALVLHVSSASMFVIQKYPLSISYFLLFTGVSMIIYYAGHYLPDLSRVKMIIYLSKNLLIATILHYVTFTILNLLHAPLKQLIGIDLIARYAVLSILLAPILCLFILVALVYAANFLWQIINQRHIAKAWILPHTLKLAILIVSAGYFISRSISEPADSLFRFLFIFWMAFFGMVLRETKSAQKMDIDVLYAVIRQAIIPRHTKSFSPKESE
jgi:hypothetical protein